ncbi:glycosyltransferase family 2 protein [Stieleria sp. JC731]|uniref:glycosyltransferase family 2 protein n=1 Tax=Pirellulaceae TaxID=2691357 RepID=UPI001E33F4C3|nr:galactosyltransferase-related protein [Stieleria sp. JC731]MCC9600451.1 glycosyltransferase family 2 protein [Stieleria sp. JC731]
MTISLLTIVRGRQSHLENQCRGLCESTRMPDEWVIVGMDQDVDLASSVRPPVKIKTARVDGDGKRLPLAEARNRAVEVSSGDQLVFLDVDCIPSAEMVDLFYEAMLDKQRLWMGRPRYLPQQAADGDWDLSDLEEAAVDHPLQPRLKGSEKLASKKYEMFWSLCFCISRSHFDRIGGFDERYEGYGGEDTDFAFSARRLGIPFGFVDAVAYHQYHAVYKPPMNHLSDIVSNAKRFHQKWGVWPMKSWLRAFANNGLVQFDPIVNRLDVVRAPTAEEVQQSRCYTPAGF